MNQNRTEILDYYSNLVNEVDIISEKAIRFFRTEAIVHQINSSRDKIISKIKEVEKIKLKNLKHSHTIYDGLFCFFIPRVTFSFLGLKSGLESKKLDTCELFEEFDKKLELKGRNENLQSTFPKDVDYKFEFRNDIGLLVILNSNLNKKFVDKLIGRHESAESEKLELDQVMWVFDTNEECVKFSVISQLIKAKRDDFIVDLSQKENNQMVKLDLTFESNFKKNTEILSVIKSCLNIDSIRYFKYNSCDYKIQNNVFKMFKNLTKLNINLRSLESLEMDVFNGLEKLEILKFSNTSFLCEPEAFITLRGLKKLILHRVTIRDVDIFKGLPRVEKLVMKGCSLLDFQMETLNGLKSLESLQIFNSRFEQIYLRDFNGLKCLKSLESDYEPRIFRINKYLEIISLKFRTFNILGKFEFLTFLSLRTARELEDIYFLNNLKQLEFLDFKLANCGTDTFKIINLPELKFLVLTCENTPNFEDSFNNLQGVELIGPRFISSDQFINLVSLNYLAITNPDDAIFKICTTTSFKTLKELMYFKIESDSVIIDSHNEQENINQAFLKFFQDPERVVCRNSYSDYDDFVIEMSAKLGDEEISDTVFFEEYLQVSESVREFLLSGESSYSKKCFRNTKRRRSNFVLDNESSDEDEDNNENDEENFRHSHDFDNDYDSDDDNDDDDYGGNGGFNKYMSRSCVTSWR
ncbi:unnamed protein product [Brachionus calyciflorus]|uniref:Uncharacterized protein n=1 Tax=Brachionus calyciflorus TaxID=104777 RepID=A0A814B5C7_9BILA|nr:unnamed protein product [Brachionus calyciflorus]